MSIDAQHAVGILVTVSLIIGVGVLSGRKMKAQGDFATGGCTAGKWIVCGTIMGSLVSGQSTLGTAQLAFLYGMSAWWYTLGAGLGCAVLAWGYVKPMKQGDDATLMKVISREYGPKAEYAGSILSSIGIIISIISQILAAGALLTAIFHINSWVAFGLAIGLMIIYVLFGGIWGAGMGGVLKLILLYGLSIIGLIVVLTATQGVSGLYQMIDTTMAGDIGSIYDGTTDGRYFNLVARGASKDIGSGVSLILGVLSTQTYAQAIWAGKNKSQSKKGALLAAFLIPPIGIACIAIGMFMRGHCITADEAAQLMDMGKSIPDNLLIIESTAQVFPAFVINYLPGFVGGMALGTLLITIVGGGAGLSLGVAVIIVDDIVLRLKPEATGNKTLLTRMTIVFILLVGMVIGGVCSDAIINDMGFLSMGLRGAVVCVPFTCALFFKGRIKSKAVTVSMIAGPTAVIAGSLAGLPFDPLFLGVIVNIMCVALGRKPKKDALI